MHYPRNVPAPNKVVEKFFRVPIPSLFELSVQAHIKYTCNMEKRAYNFVRPTGPSHQIGDNVVFYQGVESSEKFDVKAVVNEWKDRLQKMRHYNKFGCNMSGGAKGYKVACIFE
ncbi:hypothetical protein Aduo_015133 [Ancylostoma duodenale]